MKYTWEPCDIRVGRHVDSHNRAERYIIGYDPRRSSAEGNLILVSFRDGNMVTQGHSEVSLAEYLSERENNRGGFRPVDIREDDIPGKEEE